MFFPRRIPEPKIMEKMEMDTFEELSRTHYKRWLVPLVDDALAKADVTEGIILDVGCGPGFLTKEVALRSKKLKVVGLDISNDALLLAKKNCKGIPNTSIKKGSVYNLPFADDTFDLVICKDSLHHFDRSKKALSEMMRILKKNGVLYVQDLRRDLPQYLLKRATPPDTVLKKLQYYSTRAAFTKAELEKVFQDLHITGYTIKTRNVTSSLGKRYAKQGINAVQLREGFQARYIAIARKNL